MGVSRDAPPRGDNIAVELQVSLDRVVSGGTETVALARTALCTACHGSGARAGTHARICPRCQGAGNQSTRIRSHEGHGEVVVQHTSPCNECAGSGHLIDHPCRQCRGIGKTTESRPLSVTVPVGVAEGTVVRIPGQGQSSATPGGEPGDVFVTVHTRRDPRFSRAGADLWRIESLTVPEAVLGTVRKVPTLQGPENVTVAAGTQPDTVMRLAGRGLPESGQPGRGDLYLRWQVTIPIDPGPRERALYEQLRTLETGRLEDDSDNHNDAGWRPHDGSRH